MAQKQSATGVAARAKKEIVRVTFRLHGPELEQVREVREMLSLNSELDAARYLMQRGLEAMTPVLMSRRAQTKMAQGVTADQVIGAMAQRGFDPEKMLREMVAEEKKLEKEK
jgi:non-ribosomal peptide synthetase component E (peptide arylation enzyme)